MADPEQPSGNQPISAQARPSPVAEAMAPLGDNFVRVFTFIGATQSWVFYDPLIPDESTLKHLESGEVYWILVNEPARLTINGERLEANLRRWQ